MNSSVATRKWVFTAAALTLCSSLHLYAREVSVPDFRFQVKAYYLQELILSCDLFLCSSDICLFVYL